MSDNFVIYGIIFEKFHLFFNSQLVFSFPKIHQKILRNFLSKLVPEAQPHFVRPLNGNAISWVSSSFGVGDLATP